MRAPAVYSAFSFFCLSRCVRDRRAYSAAYAHPDDVTSNDDDEQLTLVCADDSDAAQDVPVTHHCRVFDVVIVLDFDLATETQMRAIPRSFVFLIFNCLRS